jgi:DNA-binding PadR family transcriptional regulator
VLPANLYRRIRTLLEQGLLDEVDAPEGLEAQRRRYFAVTAIGLAVARAEARRMRELLDGVDELLGSVES